MKLAKLEKGHEISNGIFPKLSSNLVKFVGFIFANTKKRRIKWSWQFKVLYKVKNLTGYIPN